jgi:NADP-dependent 3-hydroxy acid dehydrogenase YdfG
LINNAGLPFDSVRDADATHIDYLIKTNIGAYLLLSGFFLEQMAGYGIEGDIINIGSMSADTRDGNSSGYVATKSAIQGFTEALRKEANPHNIRVSLVEPGAVGTDMQSSSPQEQRVLQDKREMLHAEDIARAILFILAQDRRVSVSEIQIKPLRQFI